MAVTAFASGITCLDGDYLTGPIGASTSLYRMAIVMRDSSGNLFNGATASGYVGVGVAAVNDTGGSAAGTDTNVWANGSGSAAAFTAKYKAGIYGPFANSSTSITAGMEGDVCYIVDNVTVHATSNSGARSPAGLIYRVTSAGVYVEFDEMKVKLALAIGADVTFTQTYSTAATTVPAMTAAALTGSLTGTTNGALVDVAATAAATVGGAAPTAAQVDTGIALAVSTIVSGVNEQNKEMQAQINALVADVLADKKLINSLIDILQAKGLAA